ERAANEPRDVRSTEYSAELELLARHAEDQLKAAYQVPEKARRHESIDGIKAAAAAALVGDESGKIPEPLIGKLFKQLESRVMRGSVLETGRRIDGRDLKTVRPITSQVGILPRAHGSSLFTRGETQALVVATLGTGEDEQFVDSLEGMYKQHFMLHYNFPPYSVGEVGRMTGAGRREIGHGKLAWRALNPLLPDKTV